MRGAYISGEIRNIGEAEFTAPAIFCRDWGTDIGLISSSVSKNSPFFEVIRFQIVSRAMIWPRHSNLTNHVSVTVVVDVYKKSVC
jgi:hypothetical protein